MDNQLPLLFVCQGDVVEKTRAQAATIRSHVHGTYRQWRKIKRTKQLKAKKGGQSTYRDAGASTNSGKAFIEGSVEQISPSKNNIPAKNTSTLPLLVLHGNSDPFNAATITITPIAHELLYLSYHWQLFLEYPTWASMIYNDLAAMNQQHRLREVLGDSAALHCLLASGHYIKSRSIKVELRALAHKTLALEIMRKRILLSPQADISRSVYQLVALEMFAGDYEAAFQHLKALRLIIAGQESGSLDSMLPHLWIADVWLAYHLNRRTLIDIDTWDSPLTARKFENQYLGSAQYDESPICDILGESMVDPLLIQVIRDIPKALALKRLAFSISDRQSQHELIQWLHLRTTALDGRLMNHLSNQIDLSNDVHNNISSLTHHQALNAVIALAAMCYRHLSSTRVQYGGGQVKVRALFEPILQRVVQEARIGFMSINEELLLWLLLMCAVNSILLPTAQSLQWSMDVFMTLRASMGHLDWDESRQILQDFLYPQMTEELLALPAHGKFASHPQQGIVDFISNKSWAST